MKTPVTGSDGPGRPNRITVPRWSERIPDRVAWCVWLLKFNPTVYAAFVRSAEDHKRRFPTWRLSSELIVVNLRFMPGVRTEGDVFAISSHAKSLLARVYKAENPDADFDLRRCWIDVLHADEWEILLEAMRAGRASLDGA